MSRICCLITLLLYVGVVWGQPAPPGPGFPGGIPTIPNGVTSAPTIPSAGTIAPAATGTPTLPSAPTFPSGIATLAPTPTPTPTPTPSIPTSTIGFDAQIYQVKQIQSENIAQVQLTVVRDGSVTSPARVSYEFVDGTARHSLGTAVPTDNYMAGDGTLIFNEGIQELPITFFVIPQQQNGITYFSVVLTNVTGDAVLSSITPSTLVYLNVNTSDPNVVLPQPGAKGAITPSTTPSTATTAPVVPTVAPTSFPTIATTEPPTVAPTSAPTIVPADTIPTPHSNHTNTSVVPIDPVVPFTPVVVSSASSSDDHARDIGLGVGIGVGIPAICLALIIASCCIRRKRYTPVAVTVACDKPTCTAATATAAAGMGYDKGKSMEYEVKTADGNPPMINNGAFIAPVTSTAALQQTKTVSFDKTVLNSPPSPISYIPTFHRTLPTSSPPLSSTTSPHDSHAILRMHSDDGISNSSNTRADDTLSGMTIDSNTTPVTTPTPTPTGASTVTQSLLATARLPMQGPSSSYLRDPLATKHAVQPTLAGRIADMEKQETLKPMDICVPLPLETSDDGHVTPSQQSEPMLASTPRRIATPPLLSEQSTHAQP